MALNYNAPDSVKSSVDVTGGKQMNTFFYLKKAIVTARKEQYFSQLARVESMPKM